MAEHVTLREVGLRDGIQMAKRFLETDRKREWARRLIAAGVREIELTSFVPPKIVPQFADADVLATSLPDFSGVVCSALVPNLKGAERALAAGFRHINYVLSVSEAHSQANVRRSTEEAVVEFGRIVALKQSEAGRDMVLACGLATSFGCTLQGYVAPERVFEIARRVTDMGADELIVADTVGYRNPAADCRDRRWTPHHLSFPRYARPRPRQCGSRVGNRRPCVRQFAGRAWRMSICTGCNR
jgi:hydroxymethylglutaryl-CoA lyase